MEFLSPDFGFWFQMIRFKFLLNPKEFISLVFPPAPKRGMVKFPGKGHIKRVITCQEGTFEPAATG